MKSSNPKLIAVDLSSIVKLDDSIVTLPGISVSPFGTCKVDKVAQESIQYAVKAGKCVPLFIGQIAPVFLKEARMWFMHIAGGTFRTVLATFQNHTTSQLKKDAIEKYNRIYYAFDRIEEDLPIWEENMTEVLS